MTRPASFHPHTTTYDDRRVISRKGAWMRKGSRAICLSTRCLLACVTDWLSSSVVLDCRDAMGNEINFHKLVLHTKFKFLHDFPLQICSACQRTLIFRSRTLASSFLTSKSINRAHIHHTVSKEPSSSS